MIKPEEFYNTLKSNNIDFFSGVPDSLLKDICAFITDNVSKQNHIIAANEGNAIALATGHYMASGKLPLVYMQNSGIGNTVNPILSLADKEVYSIPMLLMIGWRGEPGIKDEPQHVAQGKVTIDLLDAMKIPYLVLSTSEDKTKNQLNYAIKTARENNTPFALVVKKGTFDKYTIKDTVSTEYILSREQAIKQIVEQLNGNEIIVSTTGKTSRELFEIRESLNQPHHFDFLTVGSMGHSSQIALGIAIAKPNKRIICIDGDGALLMHMGGLGIIANAAPENYMHIVINNGAHESVGGQPTIGFNIDIPALAKAAGYKWASEVSTASQLKDTLAESATKQGPMLIEIKTKTGSRSDLGRPTIKPADNKIDFMKNLRS